MSIIINEKEFSDFEQFAKYGRGCATKIPTPIDIMRVDEEISFNKNRRIEIAEINIEIRFHHITYGSKGKIIKDQREKQVEILNKAFNSAGVTFSYLESKVQSLNNYSWYHMGHGSSAERQAKSKLGVTPKRFLNFYTGGLQSGLLGWATFPFDLDGDTVLDGIVVLDESLPLGLATPYNLGKTAVHEVGHWLGLYHTFQGGCDGIGDHVNDTAAHSDANVGKPEEKLPHNACYSGEFAPIHNYMNYVDDDWMFEFTDAQEKRIKDQIMMYRSELFNT